MQNDTQNNMYKERENQVLDKTESDIPLDPESAERVRLEREQEDEKVKLKLALQKKALEITCYVCGAGAISVFIRWLQDQTAFTPEGLAEKSVFNLFVPLIIAISAYMFLRFVDKARNNHLYLSDNFSEAFSNPGRLYTILRILAGAVMAVGGLVLIATCEVEPEASMLRILGILGILTGVTFPLVLTAANKPIIPPFALCLFSILPVFFFAFWLITSYKMNDINSIVWSYSIEIIAVIVAMIAFYRLAGFSFGAPNSWRSMFFAMFGADMCIMVLADERNFGMQLMFLGAAIILVLYNWIMIENLKKGKAPARFQPDDGFVRL